MTDEPERPSRDDEPDERDPFPAERDSYPAESYPADPDRQAPLPAYSDGSRQTAPQQRSIYDIPAQHPTEQQYAAAGAPQSAAPKAQKSGERRVVVPVIAALAVGAVLGGASGAGIYALMDNGNPRVVNEAGEAPNITVNRADDATEVTAVAAKASPSVVTLAVNNSQASGTGSGIILSEDGYVLTNNHVVTLDGSVSDPDITVTLSDGKIHRASVVGLDPVVDLAVVKLEGATGLTPIEWADSEALNVGDDVVAIGAPLGLSGTVTNGIISSLNRSITVASSAVPDQQNGTEEGDEGGNAPYDFWNFDLPGERQQQSTGTISIPVVQTDAAINPGNSGGALLNADGELIGVNVAIASAGGASGGAGSIGVGFAIPANLAQRVADELIQNGAATHGLLGASVATSTAVDSNADVAGAYIQEVTAGGAAEAAGLRTGDIITRFNGVAIATSTDLTAQVRYLPAGAQAKLVYVRGGQSYETTVTLGTLSL